MQTLFILLATLTTFLSTLEKKALKADFLFSIKDGTTQISSYRGNAILKSENFNISLPDKELSYDGKNLYVYIYEDEEITISTPTQEELIDINPIMYAKFLTTCSNIYEREGKNSLINITILPKIILANLDKMEIILKNNNDATFIPVHIDIIKGKKQISINFTNAGYLSVLPNFKLDKPGVNINDIR